MAYVINELQGLSHDCRIILIPHRLSHVETSKPSDVGLVAASRSLSYR
jgi:hypothetical protein